MTEDEKKERLLEQRKASYEKNKEKRLQYNKEYYRRTRIPLCKDTIQKEDIIIH